MAQNEKVIVHKNGHVESQRQLKSVHFDEKFITRESNCGHFRPSGLAWGQI